MKLVIQTDAGETFAEVSVQPESDRAVTAWRLADGSEAETLGQVLDAYLAEHHPLPEV